MKKIFLSIIFLILLTASMRGQVINDPTTYDSVTVLYGDDYFGIDRNLSESRTVSWGRMVTQMQIELALDLLTSDNSWSGENYFSLPVQMASEYDLSKDYAVSFHNSKYGYTLNGAWNQFVLASEIASYLGDAGDASTFVTKAGNDTITGWKRFNNTLYIYGSTEYQAGTLLNLPYWANISTLPSYRIAYTIRGGRAVPMWKDGVNPPSRLVDSTYLAAQGLGAFIPSTGTKTGINSNLTRSGGYEDFTLANLQLPQKSTSFQTISKNGIYANSSTDKFEFYLSSGSTGTIASEAVVDTKLDNVVKWSAPIVITNDTLDFSLGSVFVIESTNTAIEANPWNRLYLSNSNGNYKNVVVQIHGDIEISSIYDNGVGHEVRFPDGVSSLTVATGKFLRISIEPADATHRVVGYGQLYTGW